MKRTCVKAGLLVLVLLTISLLGLSFQTQVLEIKIFQVPPVQGTVKNEPSPPVEEGVVGGIRGTMTGAYVTSFFPDGAVILESEVLHNNEEIIGLIKEKVMSSLPDWVRILPVADVQVKFNEEGLEGVATEGKKYPQRHKHLEIDCDIDVVPFAVRDEEVVINAVFRLKDTNKQEKILFDHTVGLKFSKTLIVGFPTNDESGRGTLFWLACSIVE